MPRRHHWPAAIAGANAPPAWKRSEGARALDHRAHPAGDDQLPDVPDPIAINRTRDRRRPEVGRGDLPARPRRYSPGASATHSGHLWPTGAGIMHRGRSGARSACSARRSRRPGVGSTAVGRRRRRGRGVHVASYVEACRTTARSAACGASGRSTARRRERLERRGSRRRRTAAPSDPRSSRPRRSGRARFGHAQVSGRYSQSAAPSLITCGSR